MNGAAHSEVEPEPSAMPQQRFAAIALACPLCRNSAGTRETGSGNPDRQCRRCGFVLREVNGIWRALAPHRMRYFQRFIHDYQYVRAREGRGSPHPEYYLALPDRDLTGRNSGQWKIRARSFHFLIRRILPPIEQANPHGLDILDMGAGNGWLSYRLALRGHRLVAIDLRVDSEDGLRAAEHFFPLLPHPFWRFQSEMDRLPFAPARFDIAIFNASFHYSEDYSRTLREALRCLRRPGHILIVDTPFYRSQRSGNEMVRERRRRFQQNFGFASDNLESREFLSPRALSTIREDCGVVWKVLKPWYGLAWALRPIKAHVLHRREPAKFYIFWATVGS